MLFCKEIDNLTTTETFVFCAQFAMIVMGFYLLFITTTTTTTNLTNLQLSIILMQRQ